MIKHFFQNAFIQGKWVKNVTLTVGDDGCVAAIETDSAGAGADNQGGVLVPGMPNLHSHAFQRAMAGLGEIAGPGDDSFWSWRSVMYKFLAEIDPEDMEAIAAQLYLEMLKSGFTSVGEFHYLHHQKDGTPYANPAEMSLRVMAAAEQVGLQMTLLPVLYSYSGFGEAAPTDGQRRFIHSTDAYLDLVDRLVAETAGRPGFDVGLTPHSLRAVSRDQLQALAEYRTPEMPVHIHIAEQMKEVNDCLDWSGQRPVEWLLNNTTVDENWCLVHATHLTPQEVQGIAERGAVVGLCPVTEANLGDGLFPVEDFLSQGGRFGIGSDSNINISVAEECRILEYGQRLVRQKRTLIAERNASNGERILSLAVEGGAQALCPGKPAGIAVGAPANYLTLDENHPALVGRGVQNIVDGWLFAGNNSVVKDVYVAGRPVIRNGHHDREEEILARFSTVMKRLATKI
ncbi:formimidoylglutamate deiminase [Sneathiella chinensis]|uniref:Formimidoylglutamate deiminase n=1 Tax=Sneathiella chinensis TaxID=349750 RepID=A0ABQ5U339_9PROT|nr:formimidoylglutamate deiminase [Sneathiella chinensis]GLQ06602.1 formimidoylglutamate deiminase [Sneathiella chinensis]